MSRVIPSTRRAGACVAGRGNSHFFGLRVDSRFHGNDTHGVPQAFCVNPISMLYVKFITFISVLKAFLLVEKKYLRIGALTLRQYIYRSLEVLTKSLVELYQLL